MAPDVGRLNHRRARKESKGKFPTYSPRSEVFTLTARLMANGWRMHGRSDFVRCTPPGSRWFTTGRPQLRSQPRGAVARAVGGVAMARSSAAALGSWSTSLEDHVCGWRLTWGLPALIRSEVGAAVPRESPLRPLRTGTQRARRAPRCELRAGRSLKSARLIRHSLAVAAGRLRSRRLLYFAAVRHAPVAGPAIDRRARDALHVRHTRVVCWSRMARSRSRSSASCTPRLGRTSSHMMLGSRLSRTKWWAVSR